MRTRLELIYQAMNNTRILFGVTLLLLLAVVVGLYVENNKDEAEAEQAKVEAAEVAAEEAAKIEEAAASQPDPVVEKLAEMELAMERQRQAYEQDMLRMREDLAKTEVERDVERKEKERMELLLRQRVAQIRSAVKLTEVTEVFPDNGFLVIGAGDSKNVSEGQRFRIRRGDKIVGQVEVSSVDVATAVAEPVQGTLVRGNDDQTWFLVGDDVVALE